MEALPNDILTKVFVGLRARNNAALVCRKWYEVDRLLRRQLSTGCGLNPPELALPALCSRFCNVTTVDISYSGWSSDMGKQVDDESLRILSVNCRNLADLSLNFCTFITDVGMTNLTYYCQQLRAVRLNFTPCVSGRGLLSLVSGCYFLTLLHINRLMSVRVLEWLEFIGKNRRIESLAIRNCKGVGEAELALLGFRGWQNLREFFYEVDVVHRPTGDFYGHNGRGAGLLNAWRFFPAPQGGECCPNMEALGLTNCLSMSGTGTAWLLSQCKALRTLEVDTCLGVQDRDLLLLAENSSLISSISLGVPYHVPNSPPTLTDAALFAIAQHCHFLETMRLSFAHGGFFPSFTGAGIVAIVEGCTRLRVLSLECAYPFTDSSMLAVCQSESLETLELINCHEVTDEGLKMVACSNLKKLKVCRCFGLTEAWLTPLKASKTLACLNVEDCPEISQEAVLGAAEVVSYKCTYPRTYMDESI